MARSTSGGILEPPMIVVWPRTLSSGRTPSRRLYMLSSPGHPAGAPRAAVIAPVAPASARKRSRRLNFADASRESCILPSKSCVTSVMLHGLLGAHYNRRREVAERLRDAEGDEPPGLRIL